MIRNKSRDHLALMDPRVIEVSREMLVAPECLALKVFPDDLVAMDYQA